MGEDVADRDLLAGPFVGEFGWELFCWQGRLRRLAQEYRRIYVHCRQGHELLYRDFADVNVMPRGTARGYLMEDLDVVPPCKPLVYYDPSFSEEELTGNLFYDQTFVELSRADEPPAIGTFDVVLHARARAHRADENWPRARWDALVRELSSRGYSVACIGLESQAHDLSGPESPVARWMGCPLETLAPFLRHRARLLVGTSSGPMHFGALCGTPRVVWDTEVNRVRHEHHWNPFGAETEFITGYQPSVATVLDSVEACLERVARGVRSG